jgi:hypothetical protein
MGTGMIAFFMAAGVSAWVYSKVSRTSGGNYTSSITVAAIAGIFAFIIVILVVGLLPSN